MMKPSCEICQFWLADTTDSSSPGVCRRFPSFITRERKDWCGEFKIDHLKVAYG